jgi:anaerobic magnesium-protoporphyrin IX monomethyl ester cyclase
LVKYAYKKYNFDFVGFFDESLMTVGQYSGRIWMKDICRLLIEEGLQPTCSRDGVEQSMAEIVKEFIGH